jgi:hypothetical protein
MIITVETRDGKTYRLKDAKRHDTYNEDGELIYNFEEPGGARSWFLAREVVSINT